MRYLFTSILLLAFSAGIARYLERKSIQRVTLEKEMKTGIARQDVEKLKAQTSLYYSLSK